MGLYSTRDSRDELERAMGFPTGTTQVAGILEQQRRFLLGQAMDPNYLIWVVSLVVVEQQRLASSLVGHMGFYELRSAMEPPHLVKQTSKVSRPPQLIHGIYGMQREVSRKIRLKILCVMDRIASWCIPRWIWRSMLRRYFSKNTQLTRWKKFGG
jgi:hypothetical protein